MIITTARSSRYGATADTGVSGLTARPAPRRAAAIRRSVSRFLSSLASTSTWKVIVSAPASRNRSQKWAGSEIIRCASMGSAVSRRTAATTSGPKVMLSTKWPSMTSRCMRSTPDLSSLRTTRYRLPQSAVRMLAATSTRCTGHQCLRAATDEQVPPPGDGIRRRRAGPIRGELATGGTYLDAAVAPHGRSDPAIAQDAGELVDAFRRAWPPGRVGNWVHRDQVDVGELA